MERVLAGTSIASEAGKEAGGRRRGLSRLGPYAYLLPVLAILGVFVYWPLVQTAILSLYEWNRVSPVKTYIGGRNYAELFGSRDFRLAAWNTLQYMFWILLGKGALPLIAAWAVAEITGPWHRIYRGVLFVPAVVSAAVASLLWLWILNPIGGVLNGLLQVFGIQGPMWLSDPHWVVVALSAVGAWKGFGLSFILYLAGLVNIPQEYVEAARVDGAGRWQIFWRITWPLLMPTTVFVALTSALEAVQDVFVPIQMLTQGGPNQASTNLVYLIWEQGFQFFRTGLASATSVVVFAVFLVLAVWQIRVIDRRMREE
ncbi:carbohydrate ABC transporter permease [Kyrpidia tusciae]|uniref:Binding-protein-dependent transport systems inner membrane component n=1 Tax=Kyrpidia tusciae (strain DSM 2912 / NBRC 15312 / T2) TaxID=562970 RepID=D5WR50_KYRT2|nr:sugar ABC transporter permease [Kyrpidia tusciae]ADG06780.1 binding-protein-dependent transport systems inner membrane component [Kyrpidia tusciae DSM 2912]